MNPFMNQKLSWRRLLCVGVLAALTTPLGALAAPPALVSATAVCGGFNVIATFDQPIEPTIGTDVFSYIIIDGFGNPNAVTAAQISPEQQTVTLTVEIQLGANPPYILRADIICNPAFQCTQEPNIVGIELIAPSMVCTVTNPTLQPPNAQMVDIGLSASSSEGDVLVTVFSDEPDDPVLGDGSYLDGVLRLRARREPQSDGRVYLIVVTALPLSSCGSMTTRCTTVVVPHDNSQAALDAVNAQAAAAQAQCLLGGWPITLYPIALPH
jgi:hypothetical protein